MYKYMGDFETSTEEWLLQDNEARVWASCIYTIEESPKLVGLYNNLDDFMKKIKKLGNIELYFHNLKFDGEYIISWLFRNGYKYSTKSEEKSFSCIISDTGAWYEIDIIHKVYNKKYAKTTIYDSYKKLPLKVANIAKAFKLPYLKGEIDYNLYRDKDWILTDEEKEYIKNDCLIVAKALYIQFNNGLEKMTIGSDALFNFKNEIGGKKAFKYIFPVLPLQVDNDIRKSYKGGFCMVNEEYRNKEISGISFDVNSLYPAVMYQTDTIKQVTGCKGLPYGYPKKYKGKYKYDKDYPLYIQKISCSFKVKEGYIPTIQLKGNRLFVETEYIKESNEIVDLTLTNIDLELFLKHYDVYNIEYVCGYKFKCADEIFRPYIDYWADIKAKSEGGQRQLAKLMLNSLYGKFATNPKKQNKIPNYIDKLIVLKLTDPEYADPVYTALGSFITSIARSYTITTSQQLKNNWIYSDTDSIYLTGINEETASKYINIHKSSLGAWKLEHHFLNGKWLRPKTYIINSIEDGLSITCAGMPDCIKENIISTGIKEAFNLFSYGNSFKGKLLPKRVEGGVILFDTEFTIKNFKN